MRVSDDERQRKSGKKRISAGILLYRIKQEGPEVLLVHPGGPFWKNKDEGAWSIPKGECSEGDDLEAEARREFQEETGLEVSGRLQPLSPQRQRSGKLVHAWAVEGDADPAVLRSNTFVVEWPPRSGRMQSFPEVDRAEWLALPVARTKLLPGQRLFLDELERLLYGGNTTSPV
jgi:predicted NUDIX family NTP pyrophosphohydrolase